MRDRALLVEAILTVAFSSVAIRMLGLRRIGLLASRGTPRPDVDRQSCNSQIQRIRWAIDANSLRVPWRTACFQKGLAAQLMLRRRGIPSILYYGAAQDDRSGLHAHVWVRLGQIDVIGCEDAPRFSVLATFPPVQRDQSQPDFRGGSIKPTHSNASRNGRVKK